MRFGFSGATLCRCLRTSRSLGVGTGGLTNGTIRRQEDRPRRVDEPSGRVQPVRTDDHDLRHPDHTRFVAGGRIADVDGMETQELAETRAVPQPKGLRDSLSATARAHPALAAAASLILLAAASALLRSV